MPWDAEGGWAQVDKDWNAAPPADPFDPNKRASDELIPAGTKVWAFSAEQKRKQAQSGKIHVDIPFEIVYPPKYEGKWIWHQFWCTEANLTYLKRDFQILGWAVPSLAAIMQPQDKSLQNRGAEFIVGVESYDSTVTNEETGEQTPVRKTKNTVKVFTGPYSQGTKPWENQNQPAAPPTAAAPAKPAAPPAAAPPFKPPAAAPPPPQQAKKGWTI